MRRVMCKVCITFQSGAHFEKGKIYNYEHVCKDDPNYVVVYDDSGKKAFQFMNSIDWRRRWNARCKQIVF